MDRTEFEVRRTILAFIALYNDGYPEEACRTLYGEEAILVGGVKAVVGRVNIIDWFCGHAKLIKLLRAARFSTLDNRCDCVTLTVVLGVHIVKVRVVEKHELSFTKTESGWVVFSDIVTLIPQPPKKAK